MKKTIILRIDNSLIPSEIGTDLGIIDYRQVNIFCSLVSYALVGDLKDDNGIPYYRLLNSVGRLIGDFEQYDKDAYDDIIVQWLTIYCDILHNGVDNYDKGVTIRFPKQYTDWLMRNENKYYNEIGRQLQLQNNTVKLDSNVIVDDIISSLRQKISRFQSTNRISTIIFSCQSINGNSWISKQLNIDGITIVNVNDWLTMMNSKNHPNNKDSKMSLGEKIFALGIGAMIVGAAIQNNSNKNDKKP